MADTSVVYLPGHPRIGARRGTGCLILFSLPFIAVGIGLPWAVRSGAAQGEPALLYVFGGVFLPAGPAGGGGGGCRIGRPGPAHAPGPPPPPGAPVRGLPLGRPGGAHPP